MPGGINLASKYLKEVDERWEKGSQAALVLSNDYEFRGDRTCVCFSVPIAPLVNYSRSGIARYGTPSDLVRNIQTMTVSQDKGFDFIIDKGDFVQSEYIMNPGAALGREIKEVVIPAFDTYCFGVMAKSAQDHGHYAATVITKSNAHEMLLNGIQHMNDRNVPVDNCVAFVTYSFMNLLLQDSSFVRYGDRSQDMITRGQIGVADGVEIVCVAPNRLPAGAAFLLVHKDAAVAPKQLEEYKTHEDPPGISGTLCEGRVLYDCFVFEEKSDGIYYHAGQHNLKNLRFMTAASTSGKSTVIMNCEKEVSTNKWYCMTAATESALPAVTYGTAVDITTSTSPWYGATEITAATQDITPTSGDTRIIVVEVNGTTMKPLGVGTRGLNIG